MGDVEPLEPGLWFRAIRKLVQSLDTPATHKLECRLRHAYHLLQLTPRPLRDVIRSEVSEVELEQLLRAAAFESVADRLVGEPLTYIVRRLSSGLYEAQVRLPSQMEGTAARGPSFASALVGAWGKNLVSLEARSALLPDNCHPNPPATLSGPHLRLIER